MSQTYAVAKRNILRQNAVLDPWNHIRYFNDFVTLPCDDTTGDPINFEIVQDAGATLQIGCADAKGGWLQVACDGDDNDECYAALRSEAFIFNTTEEALFAARVSHTAGSTAGKGSFVFGLSDIVAANTIADGGTLVTSFDGALFFKGEDGAYITFNSSNAATQTASNTLAFTDAGTYLCEFHYSPGDGTTGILTPIVNGVAYTAHEVTISGLAEMHIMFGVKTHEAAEQTLQVDAVEVIQEFSRV